MVERSFNDYWSTPEAADDASLFPTTWPDSLDTPDMHLSDIIPNYNDNLSQTFTNGFYEDASFEPSSIALPAPSHQTNTLLVSIAIVLYYCHLTKIKAFTSRQGRSPVHLDPASLPMAAQI